MDETPLQRARRLIAWVGQPLASVIEAVLEHLEQPSVALQQLGTSPNLNCPTCGQLLSANQILAGIQTLIASKVAAE